MQEIWKPVHLEFYSQFYEVSSLGRVRSKDKTTINGKRIKGRVLRGRPTGETGHLAVKLCHDRVETNAKIHVLVAFAFLPTPPAPHGVGEGTVEVNHKDGDPLNNQADNLEWMSHAGNVQHAFANGLASSANRLGSKHYAAKFTEEQVLAIDAEWQRGGITYADMAQKHGCSISTICNIVSHRKWKHLWKSKGEPILLPPLSLV